MKKHLLISLISILLIISLVACNNDIGLNENTGTVRLTVEDSTATRSILPKYPDIKSYKVTLSNDSNNYSCNFLKDETIVIENVLIGTYTVTVNAYSDDSYTTEVAIGTTELDVKASSTNSATISLDWLSEGNGSFSVVIDWSKLTNEDNSIYDAISNNSLGFVAWDTDNDKAFNNAEIQWADVASKSYTYKQEDIPTTKDTRSTSISFRIYTVINGKEEVIADTFPTEVTILPNIDSESDGNESFEITDDNITSYIKNVKNVNAKLNDEDSAKNIDISWEYPKLSDGTYILTAWITNNNDDSVVGAKQTFEYTVSGRVATGITSTVFTGLDPDYEYTIHFINETNGSAVHSYSTEITPITDIRTKVKVQSIAFQSTFLTSYIMGDSVLIGAVVYPEDATYKDYTVNVTEGAELSGKTATFPSSGDYVITLTSEDEDAVSRKVEITVTVKLAKPTLSVEKADSGIKLSWDSIESSTGYTIEKSYNDTSEEIKVSDIVYTDTNVNTGVNYTYRVKATREDSKFDSEYSNEVNANISNSVITINMPDDVEREDFSSVISSALNGQYVTDDSGISLNIDLSNSNLLSSSDSNFSWYLNGVKLGEDNATALTIDSNTDGLNISSSETSNNLQLRVKKGLYTYSASTVLHYIEVDPGTVTIEGDNQVTYGTPIELKAIANGNPIISWSSSNDTIATVSSKGVVTSLEDGEVTITAKVVSTGQVIEKKIKSYIPVKSVSFKTLPNFLIIEKNGVSVTDSNYKTIDLKNYLVVEPANGKKATDTTLSWSVSNNNNSISLDNGVVNIVNDGGSGQPIVKVTSVDGTYAILTIPVYKFELMYNGEAITGQGKTLSGSLSKPKYTIYIAINGETLSSSSNSTLKNLAAYDWSTSKTGKIEEGTHTFSPSTYDISLVFGWDGAEYLIKATIKVNNVEVANISFTRKA